MNGKMYMDLFDKSDDEKKKSSTKAYGDLFSNTTNDKKESKKSTESKNYNSLFENSTTNTGTKNTKNVSSSTGTRSEQKKSKPTALHVPFDVDPRHQKIQEIDDKVPTNSVILWIDDLQRELKKLSSLNQELADEQMLLSQEFAQSSDDVNEIFSKIKDVLVLSQNKKRTIIGRLFNSNEKKILTADDVNDIITNIKELISSYHGNDNIFIKSQLSGIETKIKRLKMDCNCGIVACKFLEMTDPDNDTVSRIHQRLVAILKLNEMSEISLSATHKKLLNDVLKFEELKDITIPQLYIKLKLIMNSTLDDEAINLIEQINSL